MFWPKVVGFSRRRQQEARRRSRGCGSGGRCHEQPSFRRAHLGTCVHFAVESFYSCQGKEPQAIRGTDKTHWACWGSGGRHRRDATASNHHASFETRLQCTQELLTCITNDDNKRRVAHAGGVDVVVKAMKDHPSAELLLENACIVLLNLSLHVDDEETEGRRAVIGQAGGVEAVTHSMQQHPTMVVLLEQACCASRTYV